MYREDFRNLHTGDHYFRRRDTFSSFFSSCPLPVFAQGPVDLTFGETGVFPWSVTGILPGDHGSTFIDLHNNGTENGIVYIWVDNISTSDRHGNPGGGLANYMYFNVSHPHLNSTVILPAQYRFLSQSLPCCRVILS